MDTINQADSLKNDSPVISQFRVRPLLSRYCSVRSQAQLLELRCPFGFVTCDIGRSRDIDIGIMQILQELGFENCDLSKTLWKHDVKWDEVLSDYAQGQSGSQVQQAGCESTSGESTRHYDKVLNPRV